MNCKIKQIGKDERFETRVMELSISGKSIITPSKTIDRVGKHGEINEISLKITKNDIIDAYLNTDSKLNKISRMVNSESINVIIPEYLDFYFKEGEKDLLPKMESRIHTNTDIVVVPRWKGVFNLNNSGTLQDDLIAHTKLFIDESRKLNGKLIMGNIPLNIPESIIDELVKFYLGENVTSFVLDYGTSLPKNKEHIVRGIQKTLIQSGDYENSILYSTNVRRTHKMGDYYPADDLMTFCHGVDLIGNLHIGGGGKPKDGMRQEPVIKEFMPSQYTYVERRDVYSDKEKGELKVRNCRLQNEEAKKISKEILENRTSFNMIKKKEGAKEYISSGMQKKLDFGFTFKK